MLNLPPQKIKELLVASGIVDGAIFDNLVTEALSKKQNVLDILVAHNLITRDYFLSLLAKSFGYELATLDSIDPQIEKMLPEEIARSRRVIIFGRGKDGAFEVAMEDPTDLETIDFLERRLGGRVKPYLASDESMNKGFSLYSRESSRDLKKQIEANIQASLRSSFKGDEKKLAEDLPIVDVVNNLLTYGASSRASDIHFEALEDVVLVRYRIDGILHELIRVPKEIHPAILARIKILSGLRVDEHTHSQDGRFRYKIGDQLVDVRVSVIPTFYGEKVVLRLLTSAQKPVSLIQLGLLDDDVKKIEEAIKKTYGIILVCGPTGAGKTTTLYSLLNMLNHPEVNIVTIEDPIEYDMRYVNQIQVNPLAGITFASGLRSILRQDPNIIMVGEIRDGETADISIQAALTGHLVLSSLHTNDAVTAVPRLIDMGVPPFLISAVLTVASSQRLARKIHLDCIESYSPSEETVEAITGQLKGQGIDPQTVKIPKTFYRGRGCPACGHTGYFGRLGIFEILYFTEPLRQFIIDKGFEVGELQKLARQEGMMTMFEDGLRKIERGLTTIEEVFRVIRE